MVPDAAFPPDPPAPSSQVSLPAERSFVLQFRAAAESGAGGFWIGRAEHVVSGRAARFDDLGSLTAFISKVLTSGEEK